MFIITKQKCLAKVLTHCHFWKHVINHWRAFPTRRGDAPLFLSDVSFARKTKQTVCNLVWVSFMLEWHHNLFAILCKRCPRGCIKLHHSLSGSTTRITQHWMPVGLGESLAAPQTNHKAFHSLVRKVSGLGRSSWLWSFLSTRGPPAGAYLQHLPSRSLEALRLNRLDPFHLFGKKTPKRSPLRLHIRNLQGTYLSKWVQVPKYLIGWGNVASF